MDVVKRAWLWVCAPPIPLLIAMLIFGIALGGSLHSVEFRQAHTCLEAAFSDRGYDCTWGEFLERWQSLIGSLIALAAAAIAAVPLYQQLREMNRQSLSVAVDRLTRIVVSLEQEHGEIRELRAGPLRKYKTLMQQKNGNQAMWLTPPELADLLRETRKLRDSISKHAHRNPQKNLLTSKRNEAIERIRDLIKVIEAAKNAAPQQYVIVAPSATSREIQELYSEMLSWFKIYRAYQYALAHEVSRHWSQIRSLEEDVIAG